MFLKNYKLILSKHERILNPPVFFQLCFGLLIVGSKIKRLCSSMSGAKAHAEYEF